jgi:hypothetical protein
MLDAVVCANARLMSALSSRLLHAQTLLLRSMPQATHAAPPAQRRVQATDIAPAYQMLLRATTGTRTALQACTRRSALLRSKRPAFLARAQQEGQAVATMTTAGGKAAMEGDYKPLAAVWPHMFTGCAGGRCMLLNCDLVNALYVLSGAGGLSEPVLDPI